MVEVDVVVEFEGDENGQVERKGCGLGFRDGVT